jgi:hypothetical protein
MRYLELGEKCIKTLPGANQTADRLEKRILHDIPCDAGSNDNIIAGERMTSDVDSLNSICIGQKNEQDP